MALAWLEPPPPSHPRHAEGCGAADCMSVRRGRIGVEPVQVCVEYSSKQAIWQAVYELHAAVQAVQRARATDAEQGFFQRNGFH